MNNSQNNKYKFLEYIQRFFELLQYIIILYAIVSVIKEALENAQTLQDPNARIVAYLTATLVVFFIILFFVMLNLSLKWTEKLSSYLENTLYIFPRWRRAIIIPVVVISPWLIYWSISKMETEITFKVIVALYFFVFVNASIISLIRDDRSKEYSPLSKYIARDIFLQDRQAALAKAFTVVEDRLANKVGVTKKFSTGLINEAYQGEQSKLQLIIDGKDRTSQFRDFLAGAYGILRNPRHHALIEDDLYTSASIFAVAELLLEYVNSSEKREETIKQ